MELYSNDFCEIKFYPNFAIITVEKDVVFTLEKASSVRKKLRSFYKNKNFVMITHRKNNHQMSEEVYHHGILDNMKGLAIVSNEKSERDKAMIEQRLFDKSFAFFDTIEEAESWAKAYF